MLFRSRTTGTRHKEINEILDNAQGGFGFRTKNKALTVEIPLPGGGVSTKAKRTI